LAVCFLNRSDREQNLYWDWKAHTITDGVTKLNIDFNTANYTLRDLWAKKDIGTTAKILKQPIASHQVIFLKLTRTN
jgi:alpha-galactosidase